MATLSSIAIAFRVLSQIFLLTDDERRPFPSLLLMRLHPLQGRVSLFGIYEEHVPRLVLHLIPKSVRNDLTEKDNLSPAKEELVSCRADDLELLADVDPADGGLAEVLSASKDMDVDAESWDLWPPME